MAKAKKGEETPQKTNSEKIIDQLIKKLPEAHSLNVSKTEKSVKITINTNPDSLGYFAMTLLVEGDIQEAANAAEIATEYVKELT